MLARHRRTRPYSDPIYDAIEAHRQAYAAYDEAVDRSNANEGDQLAGEETRTAFSALDRSCRRLVAAEFKTNGGLVAQLEYMAPLLREPGAPAMPLEVGVDDQQWETAFGMFCTNLARSVAAIVAAEAEITPERVDFVGDEVLSAVSDIDLFDDFEHVRLVARAAITADAGYRAGARS